MSGLVVGVGIGVFSTEPGGEEEQLNAGVELPGISSRLMEAVEVLRLESIIVSSLSSSTP